MKKSVFFWLPVSILGVLLLYGQFQWNGENYPFALRSFFVTVPFVFLTTLLAHCLIQRKWVTVTVALIFTMPHHWLRLDSLYYHLSHRIMTDWREKNVGLPSGNWMVDSFSSPPTPHDMTFFGIWIAFGAALMYAFYKQKKQILWLVVGIFCLVTIEAWLHQSLRSPYTYIPHFEQPTTNQYWYHYYLFEGGGGAVNLDYHLYRMAEELFIGLPKNVSVLPNRLFPSFIASVLTRFINPYYGWLLVNLSVWLLALWAMWDLAKSLFDEKTAAFATLLLAGALSNIAYIAQPKIYEMWICSIVILLALQNRLFEIKSFRIFNAFTFAVFLTLFSFTYEALPWLLALPLIAWVRGFSIRWTLASVFASTFAVFLIHQLLNQLPQVEFVEALAPVGGHPLTNLKTYLLNGEVIRFTTNCFKSIRGYGRCLLHAFQLAILPALFGLFVNRKIPQIKYLLVLQLPALLTYSVMELGESFYTQFPRLVISAYPSIFILAALGLSKIQRRWGMGFIVLYLVWSNLDVIGFPAIYYLWFYRNPGYSL